MSNFKLRTREEIIQSQKIDYDQMMYIEEMSSGETKNDFPNPFEKPNICRCVDVCTCFFYERPKPVSELREVTLSDLKVGQIEKDTILWLTTFTYSVKLMFVALAAEDKKGTCVSLMTYNHDYGRLTFDQLQKKFPEGITFGLKNP